MYLIKYTRGLPGTVIAREGVSLRGMWMGPYINATRQRLRYLSALVILLYVIVDIYAWWGVCVLNQVHTYPLLINDLNSIWK
jgi:hypothetical protein